MYQPVANATGDLVLNTVVNDLGNTGGTAQTKSGSTTLRIAPVNDAPTIVAGAKSISSTDRHHASESHLVSEYLLAFQYADIDASALSGIAIIASTGPGGWQYSLDGNDWIYYPAVSTTQAFLLPSTAYLRFMPSGATNGSATLQFRAWDRTLGTVENVASTATSGGSSAFSAAIAELSLPILTNEPPTAIHISNLNISQSQGVGVKVGDLTSDDPEGATSFTYSLVAGDGDANNDYFQVNGSALLAKDVSGMAAGSYNIRLQTDEGTNTYSQTFTIIVTDDVSPAKPVIATQSFETRDLTYELQGTAEANSELTILREKVELAKVFVDQDGNWKYKVVNSPEGVLHFVVKASDAAGNMSEESTILLVSVDATAPIVPGIDNASFSTSARNVAIKGTGEASTKAKILLDGKEISLVDIDANGKWSFDLEKLSDGLHSLAAQGVDPIGNTSDVSPVVTIFVDGTAPSAPVISSVKKNGKELNVVGEAEAFGDLDLLIDGTKVGSTVVDKDGTWSITLPISFNVGKHKVEAVVADTLGNMSPSSLSVSWTLDGTTHILEGKYGNAALIEMQGNQLHYRGHQATIRIFDLRGNTVLRIPVSEGESIIPLALQAGRYFATEGRLNVWIDVLQ